MSCTKTTYQDKKAAVTAIRWIRQRRRNRPKYLRKYFCAACHGWHLTHQEKN